jgi:hypothetical protein
VTVSEPGAAPTEIDTQIVQKVEGSIASIGNIKRMTSLSWKARPTPLEFQIGTPVDRAVADVRDAVSKVRSQLPEGHPGTRSCRGVDVDGGAIVYYAVSTTSMTEEELSWFVDNTITKRLLGVSGVAQVQRGGGVDREIRVDLDPARMQALGITAVDVNRQLRSSTLTRRAAVRSWAAASSRSACWAAQAPRCSWATPRSCSRGPLRAPVGYGRGARRRRRGAHAVALQRPPPRPSACCARAAHRTSPCCRACRRSSGRSTRTSRR